MVKRHRWFWVVASENTSPLVRSCTHCVFVDHKCRSISIRPSHCTRLAKQPRQSRHTAPRLQLVVGPVGSILQQRTPISARCLVKWASARNVSGILQLRRPCCQLTHPSYSTGVTRSWELTHRIIQVRPQCSRKCSIWSRIMRRHTTTWRCLHTRMAPRTARSNSFEQRSRAVPSSSPPSVVRRRCTLTWPPPASALRRATTRSMRRVRPSPPRQRIPLSSCASRSGFSPPRPARRRVRPLTPRRR